MTNRRKYLSVIPVALIAVLIMLSLGTASVAASHVPGPNPTDLDIFNRPRASNQVIDVTVRGGVEFEMLANIENIPQFIGGVATAFNGFDITITYDATLIRVPSASRLVFDANGEDTIVSVSPVREPTAAERNLLMTFFPDFNPACAFGCSVKFIDLNGDGKYLIGETLVFDANDDNLVDAGDTVVSQTPPRAPNLGEIGKALLLESRVTFRDDASADAVYVPGDLLAYDMAIDGLITRPVALVSPLVIAPTCHFYEGCLLDNSPGSPLDGRVVTLLTKACDNANVPIIGGTGGCGVTSVGSSRLALVLLGAPIPAPAGGLSGTLFAAQFRSQGTAALPARGTTPITVVASTLTSPTTGPIPHDIRNGLFSNVDFTLAVLPTSAKVDQGLSTSAAVTATIVPGNPVYVHPTVTLSASGLPAGASASFSPPEGSPTFSSTMTITTMASTPIGTFMITVSGSTVAGLVRSAAFELRVNQGVVEIIADYTFTTPVTAGKPVTFTATATGGTPPFSFSWNFGDGSPAGSGSPVSHTYAVKASYQVTLTVTDSASRTATVVKTVVVAPQPLAVSVNCPNSGLTAGKPFNCTVSATGGTSPYTGTGTMSVTRPTKGTFTQTFSVTDANGATASGSDTVVIAAQPLIVTVDCPNSGLTAGKPFNCNVSATGGTSPYTGTGVRSVTQPVKGTFTQSFSVTDANGATASGSDSVTIAAQPLVVIVDCPNTGLTAGKPFNCNVSATGGTSPYTGTGVRSATQPTKGTFTQSFTVTDSNGASASGSDSVTIAAQPLVVTVDCPNTGLTAGKPFNCNVSATGGTSPYTGTGVRSATQPVKGTFTQSFSVTDANGVSASGSDSVTIAAQPLVTDFTFSPANPLVGQSVTFTATASGGTGPYTFSWTFGDGSTGTGSPVSHSYASKGSKTVTLSTRDANNVVVTAVHTVAVSGQTLVVTVDCPNTGLTAGKPFNCTVSATGGTAPYTGTGSISVTRPTKGTFTQTFSVTDANGATASGSDSVTIAAQPLVVTVDCPNTGLTAGKPFTCTVSATGGTSPYTGTGSMSVTRPTKGTFTQSFSVTDANAVTASGSDSVTIAAQPLVVTVDCPNTGLTAGKPFNCNVSATGGTSPYTGTGVRSATQPTKGTFTQTFSVTDANAVTASGSDSVTIAAQPLVVTVDCPNTGLTAGKPFNCTVSATGGTSPYTGTGVRSVTQPVKGTFTQTFSVTDANAVTASGSDSVTIAAQPLVVTVDCPNTGLTAGKPFNCNVSATGGTSPYTGTGVRSATQPTKGTFAQSFSVTDANAVTASGSDSVIIAAQPLVVTVDCPNTGLTAGKPFNCTVSATGGTSPYTGTGTRSVTQPVKGTFTVTLSVTDANGATASGSDTVTIAAQPLVVTVDCPNTGLTAGKPFTCNVSATGGTSPYTGTGAMSVTRPTKGTFTQSFSVTDANGVTASGSDTVVIAAQPLIVTVDCPNTGLTAGKPFNCTVSATGGTSPYTGTGTRSATQPTKGTFTQSFSVTDANAVTASGSDSVTIAAQPLVTSFTFTPASPLVGQSVTFTATASGGTGPYTFSWTFGDGSIGTGSPVSHAYAAKGSFTVTLTTRDANNVVATSVRTVAVSGQTLVVTVDCPNIGLTAGKPFNCTVSATGGTTPYTGTGSISVTRPTKGTFTQTFSVTDANGATASGSDTVTIAAQPLVVTVDCPNTGLTAGKPFTCTVSATGGTSPYTGTGAMSVTRPTKGTFTQSFSVTDANGVTASGSDTVVIAGQPLVTDFTFTPANPLVGQSVTFTATASGGTGPYTFSWTFGDGSTGTGSPVSHAYATKGSKTVTLSTRDANNVVVTAVHTVAVSGQTLVVTVDCPNTGLTAGKPFNCTVSAAGGTAPYTGTGSMSVTRPTKGTFTQTFSVTDANGATASGSDTVVIAAQPLVVTVDCPNTGLTAGKPFNCNVSATGGTSPYTGTGVMSITRPTKGTFTQSFSVTDANGVTVSGSDTVVIAAQPLVVTVDCPNTGLTAGKPFNCTVSATGGTSPYTGTGVRSATQPVKGTFTQSFSVTDANGVSASGSDSVTIAAQPLVTDFTFSPANPLVGQSVTFTATASGGTGPYTFSWTFGDGSIGTGSPVSHAYAAKGSFSVTLTTRDANNVVVTAVHTVPVGGVALSVTVDCPNTGLTAGKPFNCNVSATGGTAPYTGTGVRSATQPTKGTFTQSFSVTDANGSTASGSDTVVIAAQPLVVTADCPNTGLTAGKPFNCNVSATGGTSPYTGTGVRSVTQPVKGTFTQSFSVTDANAVTASGSDSVTIAAQPLVVTVDCPNTGLTAGKPFNCTVSATGGTSPYTGTGVRSATRPTKGTFTQSFSVTDANGVTASGSDTVVIAAQPLVVTVDCPNTGLTAGKPFNCNVSATGGTPPYTGTGSRSVTQPTKGTFTVTLSVTDANGATASGSDSVTIAAQPLVVTVDCPNTGLTAGKPFTCNVSATGGTAPYTGTGAMSVTRPTKGTFTQSFSVTDANGVTASGSDSVTIAAQPLVTSFTFTPASPLVGQSVTFTATASGGTGPYTFSWTFGDGSTGTGSPVSHSYAAKGSFSVTLTTRDANNVVATSVRTVVVSGVALVVTVDCPNTGLTAGKPFTCTVSATGGTAPYTGTGARSVTQPTKGTFTQTFSVTDANGATASGSDSVTIAAQPLVVTVDCPNSGLTAGKPFNCTVSATGGTSPYTGTGSRSVTQPTKGTFTVTLSVTDANGASASGSDTVTIAPQPLVVTVDCPNTGLTAGKPFNCNVSATGGTAPYTGTGARSVTQPTKGTFTQSFSVTDANGVSASGSDSVTIAPQPLIVTVDCPNSGLTAGKPFNCTVSATGGTSPYTGTGSRSVTQPTKGTFTQSFSVTDANGVTASGSDTVVIAAQPLVTDFTFSPASPLAGQSVTFTATASGGTGPYTFSWTFGDGSTGTGSPVSHSYGVKGSFTVTLTTRDANSATATASHIVSVSPQPLMVNFTFSPASPAIGQTVTFTATVSGGSSPYMFSWSFGDGSTGTGNPVTHSYAASAGYIVSVTVTDANGATNTASRTVTVSGAVADSDGDGIFDNVDTQPFDSSNEFSDVPLGGTTTGTIISRGDQTLTVADEPNPTGVRIAAGESFGVTPAQVSVCAGAALLTLNEGDQLVATCTSVTLQVIGGTVEITLVGTAVSGTTSLTAGNSFTFEPTTFELTAPATNTEDVVVLVEGVEFTISPGTTITVSGPIASFTVSPVKTGQVVIIPGTATKFDATASFATNGPITFYNWNFGDGVIISGEDGFTVVTHIYATAGQYTATLTVSDRFGNQNSLSTQVNAVNAPLFDSAQFKRNLDPSRTGGLTQTFTVTLINPHSVAIRAYVEISGTQDNAGAFGPLASGSILLQPGEVKVITLQHTFSQSDAGTSWVFQVSVKFTVDTSNMDVSTYTLAHFRVFRFRILRA